MTKKKLNKIKEEDILNNELEGIIIQNEHMTTGIKKIINSIENKKTNTNNKTPKK